MRARGLAVLGVPLLKRSIQWLVRDNFLTDQAAPLTSPRTCEPGPGTLALANPSSDWYISSGDLYIKGTASWNSYLITSQSFERQAGRAVIARVLPNIVRTLEFGWAASNPPTGNRMSFNVIDIVSPLRMSGITLLHTLSSGQRYLAASVLRSTGGFCFIKGGTEYPSWELVFVNPLGSTTPLYAGMSLFHQEWRQIDWICMRDLGGAFTTDYGIAVVNVSSPVSGNIYTSTANGIHHLTVTAPNPLGGSCELRYRVSDSQNYWTAYFDSSGAFKLDSVSSGVATNRVNVSGVISAGQTRTIMVTTRTTQHCCYTHDGSAIVGRGGLVDVSHQNNETTISPQVSGNWVLGALQSYPMTSTLFNVIDVGLS